MKQIAVVVGVGACVLVGCGGSTSDNAAEEQPPAFGEQEATAVIDVVLTDHVFQGLPREVQGPKVLFRAVNQGPSAHELEVLDPDGSAVDEIEEFAPESKPHVLAVELVPETYTVQCILEDDGGRKHSELGMRSTLQVR